jgi:hypothetical protein
MNATNDAKPTARPKVRGGTRVLNINDGEPGHINNAFAWDEAGASEYEVETAYGIEVWKREDFVLFAELETND